MVTCIIQEFHASGAQLRAMQVSYNLARNHHLQDPRGLKSHMKAAKILIFVAGAFFCISVYSQQFIYPSEGQTPEQQQKDEGECYVWAKGQTGYDPANPPQVAAAPPPQQRQGGRLRGAAAGAGARAWRHR